MLWNKIYNVSDCNLFGFGPAKKGRGKFMFPAGSPVYLPVEKIRTTHRMVECQICEEGIGVRRFKVVRPFVLMSSVDLFQDQWRHVVAGKSTAVYSLPFSELHIDRNAEGRGNIFGCLQFTKYGNDIECNMLFELTRKNKAQQKGSRPRPNMMQMKKVTKTKR